MENYVQLVGAEQVQNAARSISQSAVTIADAMQWHAEAMRAHGEQMRLQVLELDGIVNRFISALTKQPQEPAGGGQKQ